MGRRVTTSRASSMSRCLPEFPGTRHQTPGTSWPRAYEVPLRRMRSADGVRRAADPGRRHAGGDVQVPEVRSRGRHADQSHGDAAGVLAGGGNRRSDRPRRAVRDGGSEGRHRRPCPGGARGGPWWGGEPGGRPAPAEPFETVGAKVVTGGPAWSTAAQDRLGRVPSFVRGMVKKIYADYARERGINEITPAVMDTARAELGLEGM